MRRMAGSGRFCCMNMLLESRANQSKTIIQKKNWPTSLMRDVLSFVWLTVTYGYNACGDTIVRNCDDGMAQSLEMTIFPALEFWRSARLYANIPRLDPRG
jgi:hypothetical protein